MSFGNRLYELRKSRNISQEELAELLDVSRQSISKWENDKAYPEMTRLLYMSDYFGVSLDYLMRGVEKDEHHDEASTAFQAKNMLTVWNTFLSNLSGRQRKMMVVLYGLLVCVLVLAAYNLLYEMGYIIGKFIANVLR